MRWDALNICIWQATVLRKHDYQWGTELTQGLPTHSPTRSHSLIKQNKGRHCVQRRGEKTKGKHERVLITTSRMNKTERQVRWSYQASSILKWESRQQCLISLKTSVCQEQQMSYLHTDTVLRSWTSPVFWGAGCLMSGKLKRCLQN